MEYKWTRTSNRNEGIVLLYTPSILGPFLIKFSLLIKKKRNEGIVRFDDQQI